MITTFQEQVGSEVLQTLLMNNLAMVELNFRAMMLGTMIIVTLISIVGHKDYQDRGSSKRRVVKNVRLVHWLRKMSLV